MNFGSLNTILGLFGGISGVLANVVTTLSKGKVDLTPQGINDGADRAATIPEKELRAYYKKIGIKDQAHVEKGIELWRKAGDHLGDALAHDIQVRAGMEYEEDED